MKYVDLKSNTITKPFYAPLVINGFILNVMVLQLKNTKLEWKIRDNIYLIENENCEYLNCIIEERASNFPFGYQSNYELRNLNSINSMQLIDMVPPFDIISEAFKTNNLKSNDIDENMVYNINSKYYTCE